MRDGRAFERMKQIVEAQGGNPAVLDDPGALPQAPVQRVFSAERTGYVTQVDPLLIGQAAVRLGGGRATVDAAIDHAVGFYITARVGDRVDAGEPLATVHAANYNAAEKALVDLRSAILVGDEVSAKVLPLISHRLTRDGVVEL